MKNLINITYKCEHNPNHTLPQNAVRGVRIATFKGLEKAKEFAASVQVIHTFDGTGKFVKLV